MMFHQGAILEGPAGILEGDGDTARSLKIVDHADLEAKAGTPAGLVRSWIAQRDAH